MINIKITNYEKKLGNNYVLKNINMNMVSGKIYGFQGINGSGKTMLMRAIIGLIHPSDGSITINGKTLGKDIEFPESIGFLIENPTFLDAYSGFDNLKMLSSVQNKIDESEINTILEKVGLKGAENKKYRKYSLGMKQRLGIAAAVFEKPDIVILDEPTNALDVSGVEMIKDILKKEKERDALVIISCHDTDILKELSDEIFKLQNGEIVDHLIMDKER